MAHVNLHRPNIRFKIVYYGPNLGGRTTNIEELHNLFGGNVEFVSLPTGGGRTMYIDYMPLDLGKLGNMETVFRLYTVPGQDCDNETRKMVLNDVDGIVFVADSQKDAMPNNVESLFDLEEHLAQEGVKLSTLPMVIQYNKRDLDNIASIEQMEAELNQTGRPFFAASALNGENVKKTLLAIAQQVYVMAAERYGFADPVGRMVDGEDNWLSVSDPPPSPPAEKSAKAMQPSDRVVDSTDEQINLLKSQLVEIREDVANIGSKIDELRADIFSQTKKEADKYFSDYIEDIEATSAPNDEKKPPGAG